VRQSGGIDCVSLNLSHSGRIDHKIISTIHPSVVGRQRKYELELYWIDFYLNGHYLFGSNGKP